MNGQFKIEIDHKHDLVHMTLSGFFSQTDVERLVADRDAAHQTLRCLPNQHLTLVDIRDMNIQSQESVAAFAAMLGNPRERSRKLAFVVASSLARSQIKRAASGRDAEYFTCPTEAETWLLSEDDCDVAA